MFVKPRPYQQDIINKTLETTKSTLIQLPTGGGKTIISKEIAIGLINDYKKKILFIAPKIVLMDQTLETFKGLKPQKIHGSNNKFDKNHHILISTLQTASRRNSLNPDVIIIDEVHFGYEKKMLNKIMEYNQKARIIGLSATPYDENGYPLKGFDVIINDYDLTYMIKNKYLVPLRSFVLVKPDLSNVSIIAGDYELNQLSEAVSKNTVIMEIVTTSKPYIEKSIKTIVFAVDINHAELLKTAFQNEGFTTESLHSKSEEDDSEVIERFKRGYIKVLVSVLKLTTGFDVPETDLAIIARPTKSQNLYKQMVGRVLRIAPNKKNAILLDCGNVIGNLGKPLDPIIPKDELEKKIQKLKCKHCESENIKLKKSNSNMYWECQDCGHKKDLENKNHYKCGNCNKKYSYQDGEFELINNKLYLNCECGFETEISIATGDEEFREVDSGIDFEINEVLINNEYLSYDDAKKYIKQKGITTKNEWKSFANSLNFPDFLPNEPQFTYQNNGWQNFNDFLGNTNLNYLSFIKAKEYVRNLNLGTKEKWFSYVNNELKIKKPRNIPDNPDIFYSKNGWISWEDWLYEEKMIRLMTAVQILKIEYKKIIEFIKENNINIDSGDISLKDFNIIRDKLKTAPKKDSLNEQFKSNDSRNQIYLSYDDAKKYIHAKGINSRKKWNNFVKSENFPDFLPKQPEFFYQNNGWQNSNHFFLFKEDKNYLSFKEAKIYLKNKLIDSIYKWDNFLSSSTYPHFLPENPSEYYKYSGWKGINDFLSIKDKNTLQITGKHKEMYLSFEEARNYARNLNLKSREEWRNLAIQNKIPINIPKSPMYYLKTGWIDWDDWLFHKKEIKYLNFNDARDYVRNLNIKSKNEWKKFIHNELDDCKPANIPFNPELYYLDKGWIDWNNWLRHETNFLSFEKARDYARSLNFKTEKHWKLFIENKLVTRKPENIPSNPELYYFNKGWRNWNDWLIDNKTIGDN